MGLIGCPATREEFHDVHRGATIWVLASGKTIDHVPREFWRDKITVTVNNVGIRLQLDEFYTVSHYHRDAMAVATERPDLPVIVPEADLGASGPEAWNGSPLDAGHIYRFPTGPQRFGQFDPVNDWPQDPEALVAGPTSLHMTMHFAHYLGAAHIVVVGADCGHIDGRSNFDAYRPGDNPMEVWQRTLAGVADQLRARGTSVHSLNPWVGLWLEGHEYRSALANIN